MLLTGLRGVGKTVLLNEIQHKAKRDGYHTVVIEAHEDKTLGALLAPHLRTVLFELNRLAGAIDKVKRGLAVLRGFIGAFKITVNDVAMGLDIEPEKGAADSGDLEVDLPNLFVAIAEAAEKGKSRWRSLSMKFSISTKRSWCSHHGDAQDSTTTASFGAAWRWTANPWYDDDSAIAQAAGHRPDFPQTRGRMATHSAGVVRAWKMILSSYPVDCSTRLRNWLRS